MGGWVDTVIMRVMDMMLAIPSILLAITLMAALGKGIDKAVIAIGLVSIPEYARIVRGSFLSIKENDYVAAAHVVGNSPLRIIFRHVLPNALSVIIVRGTLGISSAVLDTAALGFLGMGVQPPSTSRTTSRAANAGLGRRAWRSSRTRSAPRPDGLMTTRYPRSSRR